MYNSIDPQLLEVANVALDLENIEIMSKKNESDWNSVNATVQGYHPEVLAAANGDNLALTRIRALEGPSNLLAALNIVNNEAYEQVRVIRPQAQPDQVTEAIKHLSNARVQLGDQRTRSQCDQTIGQATFDRDAFASLLEDGNQLCQRVISESMNLDVLAHLPRDRIRTSRCWLCGLPLGPRQGQPGHVKWAEPQCEHVLPVAIAASFFVIYQNNNDKKLPFLQNNYSWAHASCNGADKGHFDGNINQPLVNYYVNPERLMPNLETYRQMVYGWNNGNTGGIKNRLINNLRCLNEANAYDSLSVDNWANARLRIIYESYERLCNFIDQNLTEAPDLYSLATIANLLENKVAEITRYIDTRVPVGGKKKKIKSKKRKVKRKKKKTKKTKKEKVRKTKRKSKRRV